MAESQTVSDGGEILFSCSVLKCQALCEKQRTLCYEYVVDHVFWTFS